MGYPKFLIKNYIKLLFSKNLNELTSKNDRSSITSAFKFITNYNSSRNWIQVKKHLNELHKAIFNHYFEKSPYQKIELATFLKNKPIRTMHGNKPNLSSYFIKNLKT
jgi:hypothetical protein